MARLVVALATGALLAACGQESDPEPAASSTSDAPEPAAAADAEPAQSAGVTPTPAPPGARVYFIEPADGETVSNPVRVVFGLEAAGVAPAGIDLAGTGHHHLLIDAETPPPRQPIPSDDSHRHFGGGQTEAEISLSPGSHTLQLVLADHLHVPHDPPIVSDRITITVE